jgi:hypothetical protein
VLPHSEPTPWKLPPWLWQSVSVVSPVHSPPGKQHAPVQVEKQSWKQLSQFSHRDVQTSSPHDAPQSWKQSVHSPQAGSQVPSPQLVLQVPATQVSQGPQGQSWRQEVQFSPTSQLALPQTVGAGQGLGSQSVPSPW